MKWDHQVTVVNGAGATPDPVAAPATVPGTHCFRLPKRDFEADEQSRSFFVALEAPVAESVDLELYALNDEDDDNNNPPVSATARWVRVGVFSGLGGGRLQLINTFAGGGDRGRGGLFYLRVTAEAVTADRLVQVAARAGCGSGGADIVGIDITEIGGATVVDGGVSGSLGIGGVDDHDEVITAHPLRTAGKAASALPAPIDTELDVVDQILDYYGRVIASSFDFTNQANRTTQENPDHAQKENIPVVDIENGPSTNGAGTTYDYYFSPRNFGMFTLHCLFNGGTNGGADTGVTMKIYGIWQGDGTAKESCDEDDLSTTLLGGASFNVPCGSSGTIVVNDNDPVCHNCMWVHIELVVSANNNTADWTIWKGQRYI